MRGIRARGRATFQQACFRRPSAGGSSQSPSLVFLYAARELNSLCFTLAPLALAIVFFYSFTKRFTAFAHLVLGFSLGIAPAAAWIAVRGSLDPRILWLTAAVMFWTAGFDIIYACQDYEFDSDQGLFSLPRRIGIAGALRVSKLLHVLMILCLLALVHDLDLGPLSIAGIGGSRAAPRLRAQPGKAERSFACQCSLLHDERMGQRAILCVLGR